MLWSPKRTWVWTPPPDAPPWKSVNLRDYCQPQSFMLRSWHVPKSGVVLRIFVTYVFSLVLGTLLLAWVVVRTVKDQRARHIGDFSLNSAEVRVT